MNARELTSHLADLLRRERHAMADFLLALADFDRRRLWSDLGHASLFSFLRREFGLSAGAAQYRKTAAELVQRHPEVEAALREGKLCLSSIIELAKVLTAENVAEVVPRFFGLSRREAAAVAVSIQPVANPPLRDVVTALKPTASPPADQRLAASAPSDTAALSLRPAEPVRTTDASTLGVMPLPVASLEAASAEVSAAAAPRRAPEVKATTVDPLDAERARLHITVSRRLLAKLEAAKAALSHSHPGASSDEVLEAALDLLLAQRAKRNGLVEKPRKAARPVKSDAIPAAVKREVWRRAGGRCEWPVASGGVCGSTLRLELDHVTPRALGGPSTIDNLRVTCRFHNQLAARQTFGDAWMGRFARRTSATDASDQRRIPRHGGGGVDGHATASRD